jgi:diaminohydroxyphosphoribosylaminopyrimidine deaminase/5-amino-6-(5-phosphoribosylamino)uracil reductase
VTPEQAAHNMARALRLAERGRYTTHPNPRVGCVIVRDGEVVGEGFHQRAGEPHAEVHALRMAGTRARGAAMFVTLEPCSHHGRTPPCVEAVIAAGLRKVWVAMQDPNPRVAGRGIEKLREAGIEVECGLGAAEAEALNRGFLARMRGGRPWVTLKLAASLDGRTAMASGESRWISGEAARADVHRLRAEAGAVLTSSATVLADDPALTLRLPPDRLASLGLADEAAAVDGLLPLRQPDRIVLDGAARVPATAKVWAGGARRFWLTAQPAAAPEGVGNLPVPAGAQGLSLPAALQVLAQHEVNAVLVECGPRLAGALLQQQLVDEWMLYLAPSLLGDAARPLARLPGLERLDQKIGFRMQDVRKVGDDLRLTLLPEGA